MKRHIYKQSVLMTDLMHETYMAHNALDYVKALQKLAGFVKSKFPENTFGPGVILNSVNAASHKATLEPLLQGNVISNYMTSKIAKHVLNNYHHKAVVERNGYGGLCAVLGEKVNGVVCVTKHEPTVHKIFEL